MVTGRSKENQFRKKMSYACLGYNIGTQLDTMLTTDLLIFLKYVVYY